MTKPYSLWDDYPVRTEKLKWRTCLGHSNPCVKRVYGTNVDRICTECKKDNADAFCRKEQRQGDKVKSTKFYRPFGRSE